MFNIGMINSTPSSTIKNLMKNSSSVPILSTLLAKGESKNLFDGNNALAAAFRKIEMEYMSCIAPIDQLNSRLEALASEIQSRIEFCKAKSLLEEETYFYSSLNSIITSQIRLIEKKADIIDKKNKTLQAERKMILSLKDNIKTSEETVANVNNPGTLLRNNNGGGFVPIAINEKINKESNEVTTSDLIQYIKKNASVNNEIPNNQSVEEKVDKELAQRENKMNEEISNNTYDLEVNAGTAIPVETHSNTNEIPTEALKLYRERLKTGETVLDEPNALNMTPINSFHALEKNNTDGANTILFIDLDDGRFYTETWIKDVNNNLIKKLDYNGPGLRSLGALSIDLDTLIATSEIGKTYEIRSGNSDEMSDFYRSQWETHNYDNFILSQNDLKQLANVL